MTLTHIEKRIYKKFQIHLAKREYNYLIIDNKLDKSFFLYFFYKHCLNDISSYYFYLNLFSWFQFDIENIECCIDVLTTEFKQYTWIDKTITIVSGGYKIN